MEKQVQKLGFKFIKEYDHDELYTRQYNKGVLTAEFTYDIDDKLISFDVTINEVNCMPITIQQLKQLNTLLGDWEE